MKTKRAVLYAAIVALACTYAPTALAEECTSTCSDEKLEEIRAEPTEHKGYVEIDCNVCLEPGDVITKQVCVKGKEGSDITFDCNGATIMPDENGFTAYPMILIYSQRINNPDGSCVMDGNYCRYWPVENVTFRECDIKGPVAIRGYRDYGNEEYMLKASRHDDYVTKIREAAPKNIRFEEVTVTIPNNKKASAFYVFPGVSGFQLINSEINSKSNGDPGEVSIYLDAESHNHTIRGNDFLAETRREVIAVDGSSYNRIIGNYFAVRKEGKLYGLNQGGIYQGGIYLYRNCGERGVIRHSTPSHNEIINNVFYYNLYTGDNPSVWLGSRNGITYNSWCNDDCGYPWGSSLWDLDYACNNVVMQNQIYEESVSDMIRVGKPLTDANNEIAHNKTIYGSHEFPPTGCYLSTGYTTDFLLDGGSATVVLEDDSGNPTCWVVLCSNGELTTIGSCTLYPVPFSCSVSGDPNNERCDGVATCPVVNSQQTVVIGAKGGCNLEWGEVTPADLDAIYPGQLRVLHESDVLSEGQCYAASTTVSCGYDQCYGIIRSTSGNGDSMYFGCSEHDENGGDCHILGTMYCADLNDLEIFCEDVDPITECCDPATGNITLIDDGVACTDDICDPATGIVTHTPNDANCDDGDACTSDMCDPTSGCVFTCNDTIPPDIPCPTNIVIECDESTAPENTGEATATDNCDPTPVITYSDAVKPGSCLAEKTITRIWKATDYCGNTSDCMQTINVVDTKAPVISCYAPSTITPPDAPISFTAAATDNCDDDPSVEITAFDCFMSTAKGKKIDKKESCIVEVAGDTITILDSGGVGDNITWIVRSTDSCGNIAEKECKVQVINPSGQ